MQTARGFYKLKAVNCSKNILIKQNEVNFVDFLSCRWSVNFGDINSVMHVIYPIDGKTQLVWAQTEILDGGVS